MAQRQGARYYVPQIDSLRALAVLAVLVFHLDEAWLPGGFSGVDVFFVISGYVVSSSLVRSTAHSFGAFTLEFYARRLLRILPALLVCVVATTLFTALFIPNAWLSNANYTTLLLALVGLSNVSLMFAGDGYFAPRSDFNPATHTWSLGVEEQFYLVFPAIYFLWLMQEQGRRDGTAGRWLLPALVLASLAYSTYASLHAPIFAYYSLPSRFWELGVGALLFQLHHSGRFIARSSMGAGACLVLAAALMTVAFAFSDARLFPIPWALAAASSAALFIDAVVACGKNGSTLMRALAWTPLVAIGKISYSLYLWHWPVYVLFRWTVGLETPAAQLTAVLIVIILSTLSYRFIELPVRHNATLLRRPAPPAVGTGVTATLCSMVVVWIISSNSSQLSLSVTRATRDWYPNSWPLEAAAGDCRTTLESRDLAGGHVVEFVRTGNTCGPVSSVNLFVIGDSHATALVTMLSQLAVDNAAQVHIYHKPGCGFLRLQAPASQSDCAAFAKAFTNELSTRTRAEDIVLLPSLRIPRIANQWGGVQNQGPSQPATSASEGVTEAVRWLGSVEHLKLRVVFMAPTPVFGAPPFRCSDWFNRNNPACQTGLQVNRDELLERRASVLSEMRTLAAAHLNVEIWDPLDRLCPSEVCTALHEGRPIFFDGDHLSGYGNMQLYEPFRRSVLEANQLRAAAEATTLPVDGTSTR